MADKKLNEVSQLTDFDYALVVKGNDVAKVTKQQLATILGGLAPFTFFLKPYKSHENVVYNNQSELCKKGISLVMCYNYNTPTDAYIIFLVTSKGNISESPKQIVLASENMSGKIGWYGTLELSKIPKFNVTIKSILLG